jgi:uncharacterized membrane protein YdjX (TVP38/TMEM64 family)
MVCWQARGGVIRQEHNKLWMIIVLALDDDSFFLPLSREIIAMINVMAFGSVWGVVYTWLGAMAGAYVSFFISRWYGFRINHWLFPKLKVESLAMWSYIDSPWSLLMIRFLLPEDRDVLSKDLW